MRRPGVVCVVFHGACRAAIAVIGSRRTDCRTFTGYRLSLGVSFRLLRSKSVQIAAREIVLSRFGVGLGKDDANARSLPCPLLLDTCSRLMDRESLVNNKFIRETLYNS